MPKQTFSIIIVLFTLFTVHQLSAQRANLDVNVELTGTHFNPDTNPERTINTNFRDDDPFNPVRLKLFPSIHMNEMLGIEGDFLFDNKGKKFDHSANRPLRVDGLFLSIKGLFDNRVNFWLGKIPTPVGAFSPRSYSHINPLIGFPLAYQYKVPYNVFTLSSEANNLNLRDNYFGAGTTIYEACWITGLSLFGNLNETEYTLTIGRGTLTNPEASANKGFQIAGRIRQKFSEQFSAGVSAGIAPYLEHDTGLPSGTAVRDPKHFIAGIDAGAHLSDLHLFFEAFYNSWDTPQYQVEKSIQAYSWYLEGQYYILSNFYAATRVNQMLYSDITDPFNVQQNKTPWGYNVTRIESGVGFIPFKQLNIKAVIQHNIIDSPSTKTITLYALQAAFRFENLLQFGTTEKTKYE